MFDIDNFFTEKEVMILENETLAVSITFKPARANGLIMLLTTADKSETIFAAGLRNGKVYMCCFIVGVYYVTTLCIYRFKCQTSMDSVKK